MKLPAINANSQTRKVPKNFQRGKIKYWISNLDKQIKANNISANEKNLLTDVNTVLTQLYAFRSDTHGLKFNVQSKEIAMQKSPNLCAALSSLENKCVDLNDVEQINFVMNSVQYCSESLNRRLQKLGLTTQEINDIKNNNINEQDSVIENESTSELFGATLNISSEQVVRVKKLGQGNYGVCYLYKIIDENLLREVRKKKLCGDTDDSIVIKQYLDICNEEQIATFIVEGKLGEELRKAYVATGEPSYPINLTTLATLDNQPIIVSRAEQNDCLHYLTDLSKKPTADVGEKLVEMFHDIYKGLIFIHANNFLHLDIALRNILISPDNRALLSDLGFIAQIAADLNAFTVIAEIDRPLRWLDQDLIHCLINRGIDNAYNRQHPNEFREPREIIASRASELYALKVTMLEMIALSAGIDPVLVFDPELKEDAPQFARRHHQVGTKAILMELKHNLKHLLQGSHNGNASALLIVLDKFDQFFSAEDPNLSVEARLHCAWNTFVEAYLKYKDSAKNAQSAPNNTTIRIATALESTSQSTGIGSRRNELRTVNTHNSPPPRPPRRKPTTHLENGVGATFTSILSSSPTQFNGKNNILNSSHVLFNEFNTKLPRSNRPLPPLPNKLESPRSNRPLPPLPNKVESPLNAFNMQQRVQRDKQENLRHPKVQNIAVLQTPPKQIGISSSLFDHPGMRKQEAKFENANRFNMYRGEKNRFVPLASPILAY